MLSDPDSVVTESMSNGLELPIDWDHFGEEQQPQGGSNPAAGWIPSLSVRDGGIWADVRWTDAGRQSVESRSYRYVSPEFLYLPSTEIVRITGASLVNKPALAMQALAREAAMSGRLDALSREVEALREQVAESELSRAAAEVEAALNAACASGVITPADKDHHRAAITSGEGGMERFRRFVTTQMAAYPGGIAGRADSRLGATPGVQPGASPEIDRVAALLGRDAQFIRDHQRRKS